MRCWRWCNFFNLWKHLNAFDTTVFMRKNCLIMNMGDTEQFSYQLCVYHAHDHHLGHPRTPQRQAKMQYMKPCITGWNKVIDNDKFFPCLISTESFISANATIQILEIAELQHGCYNTLVFNTHLTYASF